MSRLKKYEVTGETKQHCGRTLCRIKRLSDGLIGGWVEKEDNLSHEGSCFIYDEAMVYDRAKVLDNAIVKNSAEICGHAEIADDAQVYGNANVYDSAQVCDNAKIYDDAEIFGNTKVDGHGIWTTIVLPEGYSVALPEEYSVANEETPAKCECGAHAIGSQLHSDWCPLYMPMYN